MSRGKKKKAGTAEGDDGLKVECPCCETMLLVDAATGVILREDRKKGPKKSFDDALSEERSRRQKSDELFGDALRSQRDRDSLLERKFEEAVKKAADEPDEKPPNPFDYD